MLGGIQWLTKNSMVRTQATFNTFY